MSSVEQPEGLPSSSTVEVKGSDEEKREVDKSPSDTVIPENSEAADVAEDISEKKQETTEKSNEKNAVSGTQVDGLPPGWIKEVMVRRAKGHTRKDSYYLDPSSDYAFLSKLDALRYLENGDIHKCAIKPRKKSEILMKAVNTPPIKSKSGGKKSTKKSTSTPPSRASKRVKTSETVEPQSEEKPEKEKIEDSVAMDDTEEVKDKVEKSNNDEKTEVPLISEPVNTVNGDVPTEVPEIPMSVGEESVGIEERKNEVANEV